jgi:hypothetical protein
MEINEEIMKNNVHIEETDANFKKVYRRNKER